MSYNTHDLGDQVTVTATFTNATTGALVDPTVVKLTVRTPAGATETYTYNSGDGVIVKDSQGVYHADLDANAAGEFWYYRWWSTGTGKAAAEKRFAVRPATAV